MLVFHAPDVIHHRILMALLPVGKFCLSSFQIKKHLSSPRIGAFCTVRLCSGGWHERCLADLCPATLLPWSHIDVDLCRNLGRVVVTKSFNESVRRGAVDGLLLCDIKGAFCARGL